jgi:hypothetical protein
VLKFLRRWSHRELLVSWVGYWLALIAVVAAPAVARWWSLRRSGAHGSVSIIVEADTLETILWITGPPLLTGIAWLLSRPPRAGAATSAAGHAAAPHELPPPAVDESALAVRARPRADAIDSLPDREE